MSSSSSPCAACKFLRRKCTQGCVFSPYFPPDQPTKFANVHRVFGASNVAKLLNELPPAQREDAVNSLAYEAEARLRDPVYGCVGYISLLQHKINQIKDDLKSSKRELAAFIGPAALGPFLPPHHPTFVPAGAPFHQPLHHGPPPYGVAGMGMGMGLGLSAAPQMQQQQMVDAQHLAAAAREQEMLRTLEQQQQNEMARFNSGFVDGRGFGHNGGAAASSAAAGTSSGASPPAGLALVSPQQFDNQFHVQSQSHHHHQQQQQQQIQLHQYVEQHHRAGSDDGRSGIGPAS